MGEKLAEYMSKMTCLGLKLPNLPDLFPNSQPKKKKKKIQKIPQNTALFTPSHKDNIQITVDSIGLIVLPHFKPLFN